MMIMSILKPDIEKVIAVGVEKNELAIKIAESSFSNYYNKSDSSLE